MEELGEPRLCLTAFWSCDTSLHAFRTPASSCLWENCWQFSTPGTATP